MEPSSASMCNVESSIFLKEMCTIESTTTFTQMRCTTFLLSFIPNKKKCSLKSLQQVGVYLDIC